MTSVYVPSTCKSNGCHMALDVHDVVVRHGGVAQRLASAHLELLHGAALRERVDTEDLHTHTHI